MAEIDDDYMGRTEAYVAEMVQARFEPAGWRMQRDLEDLADYWQRRALEAEARLESLQEDHRTMLTDSINHSQIMMRQILGAVMDGGEAALRGAAAACPE